MRCSNFAARSGGSEVLERDARMAAYSSLTHVHQCELVLAGASYLRNRMHDPI
jgi:hypothetical protein